MSGIWRGFACVVCRSVGDGDDDDSIVVVVVVVVVVISYCFFFVISLVFVRLSWFSLSERLSRQCFYLGSSVPHQSPLPGLLPSRAVADHDVSPRTSGLSRGRCLWSLL